MIVGDSFIFIHNPKTGGSSIRGALLPQYGRTDKQHAGLFPPRGYQSIPHRIAVVRNPYDRIVSGYEFSQKKKDPKDKTPFDEWVLSDEPWMIGPFDFCRVPQSYWTWGCNRILRFERLEQQFNEVMYEFNIDVKLPHLNQSKRGRDFRSYYTKETYNVVTDRFKPDLIKYGYEFNATT